MDGFSENCSQGSEPDEKGDGRLQRRTLGRYRYVRLRWRLLFAMVDFLGTHLLRIAQSLRSLALRSPTGLGADCLPAGDYDTRAILVVQLDHLGDAIISTVLFPALRRRFPDASIEVLAGPWNSELFRAVPEVDRVHVSSVNRFARGRWKRLAWIPATLWWGMALRRRRFDLGIDVRGDFPIALLLWLCGARRRVGFDSGGGGFLLTDRLPFVLHRPEVQSRLALLETLGIAIHKENRRPTFQPSPPARRHVARRLAEAFTDNQHERALVVLHVGAGSEAKKWPVEHWRQLVDRITADHRAQVVLVGGADDRIIAHALLGSRPRPGVADWTGRLSIDVLAALLERADLAVGADSGPAHLAAAVATPVVVLFSGTNDPRQWRPRGNGVRVVRRQVACSPCHRQQCPLPDHPCMQQLTPARVAREVAAVCDAMCDEVCDDDRRWKGIRQ